MTVNDIFVLSQIKSLIRDQLAIPPWLALFAAGCAAHLILNGILRKPASSPVGLIGPLVFGVVLEAYEIWDHYRQIGLFAGGNDPLFLILIRHGLDILLLLIGPVMIIFIGSFFDKPG